MSEFEILQRILGWMIALAVGYKAASWDIDLCAVLVSILFAGVISYPLFEAKIRGWQNLAIQTIFTLGGMLLYASANYLKFSELLTKK